MCANHEESSNLQTQKSKSQFPLCFSWVVQLKQASTILSMFLIFKVSLVLNISHFKDLSLWFK